MNEEKKEPAESEPKRSTRKHAKYPKKLGEYAQLFGQDERTIKNWIRRGKDMARDQRPAGCVLQHT